MSIFGNSSASLRPACCIASIIDTAHPSPWGATRNHFVRLALGGSGSNMAWYGIVYLLFARDANNDQGHFQEVDCSNLVEAGFAIYGTQSRQHIFYNCTVIGGKRGYMDIPNLGGSCAWIGGGVYDCTTTAFEFHGNSAGGINTLGGNPAVMFDCSISF
jgi:hypothetical protein